MSSLQALAVRPGVLGLVLLALSGFSGAAQACPDYTLNGTALRYTGDQLFTPQRIKVQAGGQVSLDNCPDMPGTGFVARRPDFTITYRNGRGKRLELRVDSECDAVLLVNRPDGSWLFDDDSNGNADPKISMAAARDGVYDVWIGRLGSQQLCNATLTLETF
jgi:hypothetical protein